MPAMPAVVAPVEGEISKRKAWTPKQTAPKSMPLNAEETLPELPAVVAPVAGETPKRKVWTPKNASAKPAPTGQEDPAE